MFITGVILWSMTSTINIGLLIYNTLFLIRSIKKLKMTKDAFKMLDYGFIYIDYHTKYGKLSNIIPSIFKSSIKVDIIILDMETMESIEEKESILIDVSLDYYNYSDMVVTYEVSDVSKKIVIKDDANRISILNRNIIKIIQNHIGDINKEHVAVIDQFSINNREF